MVSVACTNSATRGIGNEAIGSRYGTRAQANQNRAYTHLNIHKSQNYKFSVSTSTRFDDVIQFNLGCRHLCVSRQEVRRSVTELVPLQRLHSYVPCDSDSCRGEGAEILEQIGTSNFNSYQLCNCQESAQPVKYYIDMSH